MLFNTKDIYSQENVKRRGHSGLFPPFKNSTYFYTLIASLGFCLLLELIFKSDAVTYLFNPIACTVYFFLAGMLYSLCGMYVAHHEKNNALMKTMFVCLIRCIMGVSVATILIVTIVLIFVILFVRLLPF